MVKVEGVVKMQLNIRPD